jgi:protein-L-isoaspartate(D-aspartate) O-methyltransferase
MTSFTRVLTSAGEGGLAGGKAAPMIEQIRRYYAEEIRAVSNVQTPAIVEAFATVPREHYLGPGPWQIASVPMLPGPRPAYRPTDDADPRHVYHNVPIAIDPERGLNNGQPTALATWFDALSLRAGERVVHVGCGTGYYTAILAETVGASGRVLALETDAGLAAQAKQNLAHYAQVEVQHADGAAFVLPEYDAVMINAGATRLQRSWLDGLAPGGRLHVPLTVGESPGPVGGFMLLVTRDDSAYRARFTSGVAIYPCAGARDPESQARLQTAYRGGGFLKVTTLRRDPHEPGDACIVHEADYCLCRD